jgi:RNA polymerase sigma-70 factor (ECF subfamily)
MPLASRNCVAIATDFGDPGEVETPARAAPPGTAVADCVATFEEHFDFIRRSLHRQGVPACDVEDLMQEVFIALWRSWSAFDRARPARAWLWGIIFRVARNHLRRRWREVPAEHLELADDGDPGEVRLDAARARGLVLRALARLPEKYRTAIVLHELDGVPVNELAEQLEVPLATAYTRVRRARLAFAEAVGALQQPAPGSPDALLALERAAPPAPARVRALVMQRVRSVSASLPPAAPPARWSRPLAAGLGLAAVVAIAVPLALTARRHRPMAKPALAAATAPASVRVVDLERDLVGQWTFDEEPTTGLVRDQSGHGRDCALRDRNHDARWVTGRHGGALDLRGNAWLECPQPEVTTAQPGAITVAVWVRLRTFPELHAALATRQIGTGFEDLFFLGLEGQRLRVNSHAWEGHILGGSDLVADRWYHVAFTHDQNGRTRLYLDGAEVGRHDGPHVDKGLVTSSLTLGAGQFSRNRRLVRQRLDGALDEVRIYSRALDAAEITALAEASGPPPIHL